MAETTSPIGETEFIETATAVKTASPVSSLAAIDAETTGSGRAG